MTNESIRKESKKVQIQRRELQHSWTWPIRNLRTKGPRQEGKKVKNFQISNFARTLSSLQLPAYEYIVIITMEIEPRGGRIWEIMQDKEILRRNTNSHSLKAGTKCHDKHCSHSGAKMEKECNKHRSYPHKGSKNDWEQSCCIMSGEWQRETAFVNVWKFVPTHFPDFALENLKERT